MLIHIEDRTHDVCPNSLDSIWKCLNSARKCIIDKPYHRNIIYEVVIVKDQYTQAKDNQK